MLSLVMVQIVEPATTDRNVVAHIAGWKRQSPTKNTEYESQMAINAVAPEATYKIEKQSWAINLISTL